MLFLAGLLNRSSLSFILVSVVRIISIVAILFAFAMEIYLIVVNIKGVQHHSQEIATSADDSGSQKQILGSTATNATTASIIQPASSPCGYIEGTNVPTTFGSVIFPGPPALFWVPILSRELNSGSS